MLKRFLARLLIRNAIAFEEAMHAFYNRGMAEVEDLRARTLLERAAQQERSHLERLQSLLEHAEQETICTRHTEELKKLRLEEPMERCRIGWESTPEEVLRAAIAQEMASYDFYYVLAQRAKVPALKEAFAAIAVEKRQHLESMRKALEEVLQETASEEPKST